MTHTQKFIFISIATEHVHTKLDKVNRNLKVKHTLSRTHHPSHTHTVMDSFGEHKLRHHFKSCVGLHDGCVAYASRCFFKSILPNMRIFETDRNQNDKRKKTWLHAQCPQWSYRELNLTSLLSPWKVNLPDLRCVHNQVLVTLALYNIHYCPAALLWQLKLPDYGIPLDSFGA